MPGEEAHIGRIFGTTVEQYDELPADDPKRKFKRRAVFGGDSVLMRSGLGALSRPRAMSRDHGCRASG